MTLFRDLPVLELNWFATTNFHEKVVPRHVLLAQPFDKDWFAVRNINNNAAFANLVKFFHLWIKVGAQNIG